MLLAPEELYVEEQILDSTNDPLITYVKATSDHFKLRKRQVSPRNFLENARFKFLEIFLQRNYRDSCQYLNETWSCGKL